MVIDIADGPDHVTLRTDGREQHTITAQYVIGCDGARSFVRKAAGIAFPGHTSDEISRMARVRLPVPIAADGQSIDIAGVGSIPLFRQHRTATGGISIAPLSALDPAATKDSYLVSTREPRGAAVADDHLPDSELSASIRRVLGVDLPIVTADWVRSTVANSRLADRYRVGRIFLAGDAAHLFSAGGSALNVGMLDAVEPGLEARRGNRWLGAGGPAGQLSRRAISGRRACIATDPRPIRAVLLRRGHQRPPRTVDRNPPVG